MHAPVDGPSLLNLYEKGVAIVYVPVGLIIRLRMNSTLATRYFRALVFCVQLERKVGSDSHAHLQRQSRPSGLGAMARRASSTRTIRTRRRVNCPLKQSAMSTLGGSCSTANCGSIWSAALPPGDVFANQNFANHMKNLQPPVPYNPPAQACLPQ
jgi:hypothetical protein